VSTSPAATTAVQSAIKKLAAGSSLTAEEARSAFDLVMAGEATPVQVSSLLMALRVKGETTMEVAGVVRALRDAMVRLPAEDADALVDTCGTGGGAIQTFNVSTAAALLAAGAGVRIAKHGNRSFTTQCGSADVLEALGVNIDVPVETMASALRSAGIVFMFAPLMHPAMRHVGPIRRELGIPTVMNIVGPLANPAMAGRQVVGVGDEGRVPLLAGALNELGTRHALVVHGSGMDEVSPLAPTHVIEIRDGKTSEWTIDPARFGYTNLSASALAAGPPSQNAMAVMAVLEGDDNHAARGAVTLNAGAAIYVAGKVKTYGEGVELAEDALRKKKGIAALERLRAAFGPKTQ
jgi:anthranilate phosphoribosyltransferase